MAYLRLLILSTFQAILDSSQLDTPRHLQPLGKHRPPIGTIESRSTFPTPSDFFSDYLQRNKPVLFRGIMENGCLPAYMLWTDDYLRKTHGQDMVEVEYRKKEVRDKEMDSIPMSSFLDIYEKEDVYLVSDISSNMARDVNVPRCIACGGLADTMLKVILWFSSGGTKSVLHKDSYDNINCLLDGEKYLVMIDRKHADFIESEHWIENGAYHQVDVEKVDLNKYPEFKSVPWYEVKMTKGDCLFIPFQWYHHVDSSSKGRNLALNFWFRHGRPYNKSDCNDVNLNEPMPLMAMKHNTDPDTFREELLEMFMEDDDTLTEEQFVENMEVFERVDKEAARKLFHLIDLNDDLALNYEEIDTFDVIGAFKVIPILNDATVPHFQTSIKNTTKMAQTSGEKEEVTSNKGEHMSDSNLNIHEEL